MKTSILLSVVAFSGFISAATHLLPRAIGDSCKAPEGSGTCQSTGNCKGISYPNNFCPKDPNDVQCCVNIPCSPPNSQGICRHTNQGCPTGKFRPGFCPGDSTIQCCDNSGSSTPNNECSDPKPNTCSFYPNCLESRFHCGASGYPLGYGLNYCNKFTAASSRMSPAGKAWVTKTMLCLQRALVLYGDGSQSTTCPALRSYAFGTHPDCYVKSGVCTLPPSDWEIIISTVSFKELFSSLDALKATLQAVGGCVDFYLWLVDKAILKVLDKVADIAKDVWHTVTGWF